MSLTGPLRGIASAVHVAPIRRRAGRIAQRRGRALVLVFHRVGRPRPWQVVPAVPFDRFRAQLNALRREFSIVGLDQLSAGGVDDRPRVAITFDDDYACHAQLVGPWLEAEDLPATFFWSGRDRLGLGPYWWQRLEDRIRHDGLASTARALGLTAHSPANLAAQIEGTDTIAVVRSWSITEHDLAPHRDFAWLETRRFEMGFHTAGHDRLTDLDEAALSDALASGRSELESEAERGFARFAYPHGKAGSREAAAVRAAGFSEGYTGTGRAVSPSCDPFLRSRWEPGPMAPSRLVREVSVRLNRSADAR